ncbi:MAG: bacteriorhodopsin-like [Planctomycetota bacterium]
MPTLDIFGYNVVYNLLSLTVATMGAATLFFFFAPKVGQKYKPAMVVTGLVTAIACYHYFQIRNSFGDAFTLTEVDGAMSYVASGKPFNDFYRYADWLLTVPLLMVELIAVMALTRQESAKFLKILIPAVILMIVTGYPGENAITTGGSSSTIWLWFIISMVFFVAILAVLFTQLTAAVNKQPEQAKGLINFARVVVLITWSFYPIAYLIGALGRGEGGELSAGAVVGLQVGYTIADITAKAGFGVVIYMIAARKSEIEGLVPASSHAAAPAAA